MWKSLNRFCKWKSFNYLIVEILQFLGTWNNDLNFKKNFASFFVDWLMKSTGWWYPIAPRWSGGCSKNVYLTIWGIPSLKINPNNQPWSKNRTFKHWKIALQNWLVWTYGPIMSPSNLKTLNSSINDPLILMTLKCTEFQGNTCRVCQLILITLGVLST